MSRGLAGAVLAALGLTAMLAGCRSAPPLTPEEAVGQHIYAVRCAHCHDENDLALKPPPPSLHNIADSKLLPNGGPATDAAIAKVVMEGKNKMPSFAGRFTDAQMAGLIAYLRTSMPPPAN